MDNEQLKRIADAIEEILSLVKIRSGQKIYRGEKR
jgi:hypothetical protein